MKKQIIGIMLVGLFLSSCQEQVPVQKEQIDNDVHQQVPIGMPNPASKNCIDKGYKLEIREDKDGGQYGICIFSNGSECEEWKFFRGECEISSSNSNQNSTASGGIIEGSLSFPSEKIPEDMMICAENIFSQKSICTSEHIISDEYLYGVGYKLSIPVGEYLIYAQTKDHPDYKAYYNKFVLCGLEAVCTDHTSIPIVIKGGEIIRDINPIDWYVE